MEDLFDIEQPEDKDAVAKVRAACEEAAELLDAITAHEEAAAVAKKRYRELTQHEIPSAMAEARMGDTTSLDTGHVIKVSPFVSGSLSKDPEKRAEAIKAIESMGGSAIIKTKVECSFGKGEKDKADEAVKTLKGFGYEVEAVEGVHPSTLSAFVRERMARGEKVPLDTLGLYAGMAAKITPPKG